MEVLDSKQSAIKAIVKIAQHVSSGGLAVKELTLGAKGHRFDTSKRLKLFPRLISQHTTS